MRAPSTAAAPDQASEGLFYAWASPLAVVQLLELWKYSLCGVLRCVNRLQSIWLQPFDSAVQTVDDATGRAGNFLGKCRGSTASSSAATTWSPPDPGGDRISSLENIPMASTLLAFGSWPGTSPQDCAKGGDDVRSTTYCHAVVIRGWFRRCAGAGVCHRNRSRLFGGVARHRAAGHRTSAHRGHFTGRNDALRLGVALRQYSRLESRPAAVRHLSVAHLFKGPRATHQREADDPRSFSRSDHSRPRARF